MIVLRQADGLGARESFPKIALLLPLLLAWAFPLPPPPLRAAGKVWTLGPDDVKP